MDEYLIIKKRYYIFALISGILLVISGIIYASWQVFLNQKISDTVFISLTIGESLFVLFGGNYILDSIIKNGSTYIKSTISYENLDQGKIMYNKLVQDLEILTDSFLYY